MVQTSRALPQRTIFMDKIRYSMVLAVVVLHAACSFASIIPWWSVRDHAQNQQFDLLIIVLDIFLMPLLFFLLLALSCQRLAHADRAAGHRRPAAPKEILTQIQLGRLSNQLTAEPLFDTTPAACGCYSSVGSFSLIRCSLDLTRDRSGRKNEGPFSGKAGCAPAIQAIHAFFFTIWLRFSRASSDILKECSGPGKALALTSSP